MGLEGRVTSAELRRKIRDARQARRRIVDSDFGTLIVTRTRRTVRITALVKAELFNGKPPAPGVGFVDLDDAGVDRLIRRLAALRGGKRALP